ncbi:MAG: hypothetical protein AAGF79_12480 [Pseudomonadota bacterium]
MCLTTQALVMFLNIIGPEKVTTEPGVIVIHAATADVHWVAQIDQADHWCTPGPIPEKKAR